MKIYGLLMTYNQMDWLPWTIKQFKKTLDFGALDKVFITEGGHSKKVPARSPDGSWEFLNDTLANDERFILFDAAPFREKARVYGEAQAAILNNMCNHIPLEVIEDESVWLFYIHDDEFFFDVFLKNLKNIASEAESNDYYMVMTRQMGFAFNMRLYWDKRTAYMLFKWSKGHFWKPITTPCYPDGVPYLKRQDKIYFDTDFDHITFHFSHVKRPERQAYRHYVLPSEIGATRASLWHREIYEKADLNNLEAIYEKNKSIMGGYGFYKDSPDLGPERMQVLKEYTGLYPESIIDHPYHKIDDIRKI